MTVRSILLRMTKGLSLRAKLVTAFSVWAAVVFVATVVYITRRFELLTSGLAPADFIEGREALNSVVWLAGVLGVSTVVFAWISVGYLLRPVSALARTLREVTPGSGKVALPEVVANDRDLWELSQAFDQMVNSLNDRGEELRRTVRERERQLHELGLITRFVEGCARIEDGSHLNGFLTSQVAEALAAERCFILRYDSTKKEMAAEKPAYGVDDEQLSTIRYPVTAELRAAWDFGRQGALLCNDPSSDTRVVHDVIRRLGFQSLVAAPVYFKQRITALIVVAKTSHWMTQEDSRLVSVLAAHASIALANWRYYEEIQQLAIRDGLTGLHNYRYFRQQLVRNVLQARRYQSPLSLLMIDVDNFKVYNDRHGHLHGDGILRELAAVLLAYTRAADLVARYGGEEFVVLLPEIDADQAYQVGEKIRQVIEAHPFLLDVDGTDEPPPTISIGVASSIGDLSADALIQHADQALYRAKAAGKNRVVTFASPS